MYQLTILDLILVLFIKLIDTSKLLDTRTVMEKQGRDVILSCRFDELQENDRVMWSKDGVVLSVKNEISGDKKKYEIFGKYDLIIKTILEQDSGQYFCQNFDQILSKKILLTVLTQPTKPIIQQLNESLIENSLGKFLCITYGGNPLPRINWLINQKKINESLYKFYPNKYQSYSELYLPLEKYFHNSSLTCQIQNQALDKPLITAFRLNIQYKPEINLYSSQTIISNLNYLIIENDYLTIDCQIDANPSLIKSIIWLKNGVSISGQSSSSLTLQNIKRNDDGEYTCLATNSIGHGQSSVHIRVQYAPIVRINGGGLINENEKLLLICDVDSYPSIDYYQWYKNNEKLNLSSLSSSIIIEKISKQDSGIYICMVKNTLKYSNGSSIEKFNKTQTNVIVQYPPKIHSLQSIIAIDNSTKNLTLICEIDSNPDSIIHWKFNNKILFNSNKYFILQNKTFSYLILQQIHFNFDYGFYSCNASNKLGYNSTIIQLRSKSIPDSPIDLYLINVTYSTINIKWKAGFNGGWKQTFRILLDNLLWNETDENYFIFTNLRHLEYYNITIQAYNQLGESLKSVFIRVQTKDIPIKKHDLPLIEYSLFDIKEKLLHYQLNNLSFNSIQIPLCLKIEISNQTKLCQRIVTSSGMISINEYNHIDNISICIDQYEDFCGESVLTNIKYYSSYNWIFILVSSIIIITTVILSSFCIFYLILNQKRKRTNLNNNMNEKNVISTLNLNNSTNYFSNLTYPEQQQQQIPLNNSKQSDNRNSLSLSNIDQLSKENQSSYMSYNFPFHENTYSTSLTDSQINKKTVFEVVV